MVMNIVIIKIPWRVRDHETGLSGWKCSFFLLPIFISRSNLTYRALYCGKIETQTSYTHIVLLFTCGTVYIYIYIFFFFFFFFLPLWAIVGLQLTSCWTLSYSWLTKAKVAWSRLQENGLRKFWAKNASSAISDVASPVKLVDRARFQASSGNSDSTNWPGYEAGTEVFKKMVTGFSLLSSRRLLLPRIFAACPFSLECADRKSGTG